MAIDYRDLTVGDWTVQPLLGRMHRGAETVRLEPKVMEVLVCLARRQGELVLRKELVETAWPDTFVEDHALSRVISQLRQAFGGRTEEYVETVPKRGYRLVARVGGVAALAPSPAPASARLPDSGVGGVAALAPSPAPASARLPDSGEARRRNWRTPAVVASVFVLAALLLAALGWWRHGQVPSRAMLVVLPLVNLTADSEDDYLCEGLTEEMIGRLGALQPEQLGVIARTSSYAYRNTTKRTDQIGRELNVGYVLEGSLRREGERLRIATQLIRTKDQTHLWSGSYDDEGSRLLALCDKVAQSAVEEVRRRLAPNARADTGAQPPQAEAWNACLRGYYLLSRGTGQGTLKARDLFQEAVAREPKYARAFAGLATAYIMLANHNMTPSAEVRPKAREAAMRALQLDPSQVEARLALAFLKMEGDWDFNGAEQEFRRAVDANPNSAQAHQRYSALFSAIGRFDEGIRQAEQALELDPVSLRVGVDLGRAYYFARRYGDAVEMYGKVIALDPSYSAAHSMLGLARLEQHRVDEAITELQEGVALLKEGTGYSTLLGYAYAAAGRKADAERELLKQKAVWEKAHVGAWAVALTYSGLGNADQAFAWLDKSCEAREASMALLKAYPYWDPIRRDPRFAAILRRVGLPE